jgi:hypothetical protein
MLERRETQRQQQSKRLLANQTLGKAITMGT